MGFERDATVRKNGRGAGNDWSLAQGGFRADWLPPHGEVVTLQGDFYSGAFAQTAPGDLTVDGQNVLGRWTHPLAGDSDFVVQAYWDRTWRRTPNVYAGHLNQFDLDFQHRVPIGDRHKLIWGDGYRVTADDSGNTAAIAFLPARRNMQLFSGFLQDEITLREDTLFLSEFSPTKRSAD